MAKPTTSRFGEYIIQISDGASPEVFTAPCGLTSKGYSETANTNSVNVPDCDDPDAPVWEEKDVTSYSSEISGSGVMAVESLPMWKGMKARGAVNCRIYPNGLTSGYDEGPFILTQFQTTANLGEKVQVSITLANAGEVVWHAGS